MIPTAQAKVPGDSRILADAIATHLASGSEVLRCLAARALAQNGDSSFSSILSTALMDEDPDVRADSMFALTTCADKVDAARIRESLTGDPVSEVKLAAVRALGNLKDISSVPLLEDLALSRSDDLVYWDDTNHGWDDWLDIQLAAIEALGSIGEESSLPKLLMTREDEMGQVVDVELFRALGRLGASGIESLHGFLSHSEASVRQLACNAFLRTNDGSLDRFADTFAQDSEAAMRRMAIRKLPVSMELLRIVAANDTDSDVRVAAIDTLLNRCQSNALALEESSQTHDAIDSVNKFDIDLLLQLLEDSSENIRSSALNALLVLAVPSTIETLRASLTHALINDELLPVDRADTFVDVLGVLAHDVLGPVSGSDLSPLENRLAAIKALKNLRTPAVLGTLAAGVIDQSQQVRVACLNVLSCWCIDDPDNDDRDSSDTTIAALRLAAVSILARAIGGELYASKYDVNDVAMESERVSGSDSNTDDVATPEVAIADVNEAPHQSESPDIETASQREETLSWHDPDTFKESSPQSTLDAILLANSEPPATKASDLPVTDDTGQMLLQKGKRRRVSVEGPENFACELQVAAIRECSTIDDPRIDKALNMMLDDSDEPLACAVLKALAVRTERLSIGEETLALVRQNLQHESAEIRCIAGQVMLNSNLSDESIQCLKNDDDALCRALFISHSSADDAYDALRDSAAPVRMAAVERLMGQDEPVNMKQFISACLVNGGTDSLRRCLGLDARAGLEIASLLSDPETSPRSLHFLLLALCPS